MPPTSPALLATLNDDLGETYSAGSAFDAKGDLFVTDDFLGDVVEYSPTGAYMGVFASGLQNPLSVAFDQQGNLYVGQQGTNTIAEFNPSGGLVQNIGPVPTENAGTDWITLANQCTIDYTSEGTDILSYNFCPASPTNTPGPGPNVNAVPFSTMDPESGLPTDEAYELQVRPNGQVLVADSSEVLLLNADGSVNKTYACSSLAAYGAGCYDSLFAVSLDPDGLSFWTADSVSGYIWQVDIATGQVLQTIDTQSGTLFGLSVDNQIEVAGPTQAATTTPSTLAIQPVTGNFSTPTPVVGVLTNPGTDTPLADEPVTFTLNGNPAESCTATTDSTGTATCDITASEPSSTYTLTASFAGDTTPSTPIGSDSTSSTFTVTPDTSSLTYTGPTTGVNGQPITLSGTLTNETTTPTSSLPAKVVTFTIGSGSTAQSCNALTDSNGNVSCTIPSLDQPMTNVTITSSFTGDSYDTQSTVTTPATVTEPTVLTVNTATSDYSDSTMVSGVLTDANTNAVISGEPVTFILDNNETCTATTDSTGTATCPITPGEPAATYTLTGTFKGDAGQPLQLTGSNGSANFVVTLEETALTYTGGTVAQNGQPLTLSGVLTTDSGVGLGGKTVAFTLGSGSTAQTCSAVSLPSGAASCMVTVANQPQGPIPVADAFTSDGYYESASASSTVNLPEGTSLTVTPGTGTYNGSTTVSATLVNTYTNAPVPGQTVTLTVNGSQTCTGTTNASGVATCPVTPNEPSGTYSLTASFGGNTTTTPVLLSSSGSSTFTESKAPTTLTYTGSTSTTSGQSPSLSATLTTTGGTPAVRPDRDVHRGYGHLGPAVHRDHQLGRARQLHHLHVQPERQPAARHRDLRRQQLLRHDHHVAVGDGRHADHPVGQRRHRHLRAAGHRLGHADQLGQRAGDRRPDGHADPEREPDLHGDDGQQRKGVLQHHAHREHGHLHAHRLVRRQHGHVAPAGGQQRVEQGRDQRRTDEHHLHGHHHGHQRPVAHAVDAADEQRDPAQRPAGGPDARDREVGPELHRDDGDDGHRIVHHLVREPGHGHRDGHRLLRRQQQLRSVEQLGRHQGLGMRRWWWRQRRWR